MLMDLDATQLPQVILHGLTIGKCRQVERYQNVVHLAAAVVTSLERMFRRQMDTTTDGTSLHFADHATTEQTNLRSTGISYQFLATSKEDLYSPFPLYYKSYEWGIIIL